MTMTAPSLPFHAAAAAATALSDTLATPQRLAAWSGSGESRWREQSLSKGAAGVAILHAVRAQTGHCDDPDRVRAWLTRAVIEPLTIAPGAGLWFGAPAVAFALAVSAPDRYHKAMIQLDAAVADLTRARLTAAGKRLAADARPSLSEYDLVRGLTGLGAHLLHRDPGGDLVRWVLEYLVKLTEPVRAADAVGVDAPGWWTSDTPASLPSVAGGHADLGMAHGIAGPLALLALAHRQGTTVAGQQEAIDRICRWLDTWRQQSPAGPWWPQRVTLSDIYAGRPSQQGPGRPSWCYGTPGLARAQQLAGLACGDRQRQVAAEQALTSCVADLTQLADLVDVSLCHGWAGLVATVWYAAADSSVTGDIHAHLARLTQTLINRASSLPPGAPDGLIDGRAGAALMLHTIATGAFNPWPTCLLIN